jgi:glycosyltransferase involved in cell wall biosynthesis
MSAEPRLAIFVSFSGQGGVEPMMLNLAGGLASLGVAVDLVRPRPRRMHRPVPAGVNVVELPARHTRTSLGPLARYLRRHRPDALIVSKDRANRVALRARDRAGVNVPVAVRFDNTLSAALNRQFALRRWARRRPMRRLYPRAEVLIAVSEGVRRDAAALTGLTAERLTVIPYPVITARLYQQARQPADHPWLQPGRDWPVIVGAGRLTEQKDFPTLLDAFAQLRQYRPARLILLGEGEGRPALERRVARLGLGEEVDMPGFYANPYPLLARADVFALSSRWEGSPVVLTEALALGTPVVSVDCPSGPREILDAGRVAPLVPMGDPPALAEALARVLDQPPDRARLQEAASPYTDHASARAHLRALELPLPPAAVS